MHQILARRRLASHVRNHCPPPAQLGYLFQGSRKKVVRKTGPENLPEFLPLEETIVAHDALGIAGGGAPDEDHAGHCDEKRGAIGDNRAQLLAQVRQAFTHLAGQAGQLHDYITF